MGLGLTCCGAQAFSKTGRLRVGPILFPTSLARSFAQLARNAEQSSRSVQVPKVALEVPPMEIHTLGNRVLRQSAKRISKVDESVRDLARDMLRSIVPANDARPHLSRVVPSLLVSGMTLAGS